MKKSNLRDSDNGLLKKISVTTLSSVYGAEDENKCSVLIISYLDCCLSPSSA